MEINDLIIFKTVANEGSISKAAKELGYVQPNVTERIKKLEKELETPLLHRDNKGVSLLPSGDILLDYTNRILTLLEEAKNEIKTSGSSYVIATSQSILTNYLSMRIKENFRSYQLYIESSSHLQTLLQQQKVDMVITYEDYPDAAFKKVFTTSISVGLLKAKEKCNIDYSKELFFVSNDKKCPFRNKTIQFLKENNLSQRQLQQLDSYSLMEEFIVEGNGIAFLPIKNDKLVTIENVPIEKLAVHFFTNRNFIKHTPDELFE
ncbi:MULTISPECIES: LysR family transcriptional regulator [Bacillus]|uniref:LysR family transcriptional regulator n=1 Tax=Bacillus TaxID=1386 RepID=UPI000B440B3B|nr:MULTISPECIES: LysR family transcriptional regulator [Bacillus]OTX34842.1 LysR family transcriptional regulator [Bacillus thuringiensis serovar malayensis]OUB04807.1 LysR family transcriptional regulator [Bacillus thuringiensis serovar shandongiensis]AXK17956.1 LysR family transcriptional regulator [Bacillus sp. COPE52]MBJ8074613.1 LysR family transcriptional regulator [Bacillus cereus group sp. N12]MBX0352489.1 LysR family transcriptional regulator [Bacillus toyonensis]